MAVRIIKTVLVQQEFIVNIDINLPLPVIQVEDGESFNRINVLIEEMIESSKIEVELEKETYISEHTTIKIEKI